MAKCDCVYVLISNWNQQKQSVICIVIDQLSPALRQKVPQAKLQCELNTEHLTFFQGPQKMKWKMRQDLPAFGMATVAKETGFLPSTYPVEPTSHSLQGFWQ